MGWSDNSEYKEATEWYLKKYTIKYEPFLRRYDRYIVYKKDEKKCEFNSFVQAKAYVENRVFKSEGPDILY